VDREDPVRKAAGDSSVPWPICPGLTVHDPAPGWSFHSGEETAVPSRIDHVTASPRVEVSDVRYVIKVDSLNLAGPAGLEPITDHASIVFTAIRRS
jgi:hypothetical protein